MKHYRRRIALELKALRDTLQLTQEELAARFNSTRPLELTTSRSDISKYEAGSAECPASKLLKFRALGEK